MFRHYLSSFIPFFHLLKHLFFPYSSSGLCNLCILYVAVVKMEDLPNWSWETNHGGVAPPDESTEAGKLLKIARVTADEVMGVAK